MDSRTPLEMLLELDSRHDELLDRLADLDKQVKAVLKGCQPSAPKPTPLQSGPLPVAIGTAAPTLGIPESALASTPTLDGVF